MTACDWRKDPFGLYWVLSDPRIGYENSAEVAVRCRVRFIQLRVKEGSKRTLLGIAHRLRRVTKNSQTLFIVNDSLEIARMVDADGVHLGQGDMNLAEARACWSEGGKIFGLSTHSLEQARAAEALAPDYIGIGPIYSTRTKRFAGAPLGQELAGKIARRSSLPAVGIGGIDPGRIPELRLAGICNYAVSGALNRSSDPEELLKEFRVRIGF